MMVPLTAGRPQLKLNEPDELTVSGRSMNVYDIVMKMEDDGYKYYKNLVNTATLPGLKTIFTSMAEDEQKHFDILENVYNFVNAPRMG
jgi:rubrerythrin